MEIAWNQEQRSKLLPFSILEIDECQPNPCKNDGACSNNPNGGFSCNCKEGFRGVVCEGNSLQKSCSTVEESCTAL